MVSELHDDNVWVSPPALRQHTFAAAATRLCLSITCVSNEPAIGPWMGKAAERVLGVMLGATTSPRKK